MKRKKRSIIWKLNKEEFQALINKSTSLTEVLISLNMNPVAGNFKTLNVRIIDDGINVEHIKENYKNRIRRAIFQNTIPLENILIANSTYSNGVVLKKKLIKGGLLENKCYICELLPIWNNKPLILHLDHINGIHNDNSIKNLRMVCPNCHTQTATFGRKDRNGGNKCEKCNIKILKKSKKCRGCQSKDSAISNMDIGTKIIWPTNEELVSMVKMYGFAESGRMLGVRDNSIRKRLKRRGIII